MSGGVVRELGEMGRMLPVQVWARRVDREGYFDEYTHELDACPQQPAPCRRVAGLSGPVGLPGGSALRGEGDWVRPSHGHESSPPDRHHRRGHRRACGGRTAGARRVRGDRLRAQCAPGREGGEPAVRGLSLRHRIRAAHHAVHRGGVVLRRGRGGGANGADGPAHHGLPRRPPIRRAFAWRQRGTTPPPPERHGTRRRRMSNSGADGEGDGGEKDHDDPSAGPHRIRTGTGAGGTRFVECRRWKPKARRTFARAPGRGQPATPVSVS